MAKAKAKKLSLANLVCIVVMLAAAIAVIVGLFVNYVGVTVSGGVEGLGSASHTEYAKLFDMEETWGTISIVAAIAAAVLCVASLAVGLLKAGGMKISSNISLIVGALTVVVAIFAIVAVFVYGGQYSDSIGGSAASISVKVAPAIGAWLVAIGGFLGGAACIANK